MNSCTHLAEYKTIKGTGTYRILHAFFVACVTKSSRQKKARDCFCHECRSKTGRIHACLSCVFFGCFTGQHIQKHAEESQHPLAMDTISGNIYCLLCCDYVYDQEFEVIAKKHKLQVTRSMGTEVYNSWKPSSKDVELLKEHFEAKKVLEGSYLGVLNVQDETIQTLNKRGNGLRGLVNLGNTCFMSCILQALVHTPLLRDYFLADKHVCHFEDEPSTCLVCEFCSLFQEFYSGECIPYIPYKLLYLVWTHAKHLSGYYQQDAHEFLIVSLNILHLHCKGMNVLNANNDRFCNCIIDQIFTGFLQSELVCVKCKSVSTTVDPFWDISLDLGSSCHLYPQNSGNASSDANFSEPSSLLDCLERFTQPEYLGGRECENCQSYQNSTKQLTLQKLPLVISFHFKRLSGLGKNINFISFPECLDMTPFTSSVRSRASAEASETVHNCLSQSDNKFYLFAVVNHVGDVDSGHYFSFVRQQKNKWYKCDDHLVTKASIQEVLSSEAYLLFYHKQILEYEVCDEDLL